MKTVVGLFDDIEDARDAVDDLVDNGFSRDDISMIARDYEGAYGEHLDTYEDEGDMTAEGAAAGALGGGLIGGLAGFLVGVTAFAIPGVGPIVAAGPIVSALTGAGIGAATGGILGALVGWGIPEAEAEYYTEGVRRGGTLVGVKVSEAQVDEAIDILDDHDPVNIERRSEYWRESGWDRFDPQGDLYTREDYEMERNQYSDYGGTTDGGYDAYAPTFQQHYQSTYAATGIPYTRYEPAYRYGYQLANDSRYDTYDDWNAIEPEAQREWRQMNRTEDGSTWEDIKGAVRHAWEKLTEPFDDEEEYEHEHTYQNR
jgi:hypothetical protein